MKYIGFSIKGHNNLCRLNLLFPQSEMFLNFFLLLLEQLWDDFWNFSAPQHWALRAHSFFHGTHGNNTPTEAPTSASDPYGAQLQHTDIQFHRTLHAAVEGETGSQEEIHFLSGLLPSVFVTCEVRGQDQVTQVSEWEVGNVQFVCFCYLFIMGSEGSNYNF